MIAAKIESLEMHVYCVPESGCALRLAVPFEKGGYGLRSKGEGMV